MRWKPYFQVLCCIEKCLPLTSCVPSQQPGKFYNILLRGGAVEPYLGDKHYTRVLNEILAKKGEPLVAVEDEPRAPLPPPPRVPALDLDDDDGIILGEPVPPPEPKPKARASSSSGVGSGLAKGPPTKAPLPLPPVVPPVIVQPPPVIPPEPVEPPPPIVDPPPELDDDEILLPEPLAVPVPKRRVRKQRESGHGKQQSGRAKWSTTIRRTRWWEVGTIGYCYVLIMMAVANHGSTCALFAQHLAISSRWRSSIVGRRSPSRMIPWRHIRSRSPTRKRLQPLLSPTAWSWRRLWNGCISQRHELPQVFGHI